MYLLYFYVPETHLEQVKNAIFSVGAGSIGNYKHCSWQTLGEGQFMPLSGSNAFIGEKDQLERLKEYKVEIFCSAEHVTPAIAALKKAHPYETPAFQVLRVEQFN